MANDFVAAVDKRAADQINAYDARHSMLTGVVQGVEIGAASVKVNGSGRYLRSVPILKDLDLSVGEVVFLVRAGRQNWLIIGPASAYTLPRL